MDFVDLVPFFIGHVLEASSGMRALLLRETKAETHPLSLRIPALLIRMVTVPKASVAVLMIAAPSETDDVFTTAFPPAKNECIQHLPADLFTKKYTFRDLVYNLLCSGAVKVIHDDISTSRCEQERVPRRKQ